ncbi:2-oxoglutarate dehydrogenase E1 component [Anaeromyxobacter soli]|uniref:2-oxoglutarate dehydrogenase E1 component n=1 Tax=Anaeromyxobacter soli TaxID=2922725 RepID=UPI001FAEF609|nr:2-oxoglutarate dehydrogenase E1 component [Anaeromyxobacter sp. SG29]
MSSPETDLPVPAPSANNLSFVEKLYYEWLAEPSAVDERWRRYFEALPASPGSEPAPEAFAPRRPNGAAHAAPAAAATASADAAFQARVDRLVTAYREYGHLRADLDPLALTRRAERFSLAAFGLSEADLDRPAADPEGHRGDTLRQLVARLEETYCRTIGVELAHMHDADLRGWLEQRMERTRNRVSLDAGVKKRLLEKLVEAETLEQYLGTKFLGAKRFSVEGAEGLLPLFELAVDRAIGHGVRNVVIGMAHRGRLNVLANVVGKPLRDIFAEFRDAAIVNAGGGDVKYHLGYSSDRESAEGVLVHLSLAFNPSHLEWIDTVVQGRVRAKQDRYSDTGRQRSLPILVHGDAAFAAQGVVAESLQMSELEAYTVGGTIHVIVNNQVGFTTSPRDARSTTYSTGPARMLQIPIIHVNGEDMEAVAQAVLIAVDFRQRFHRDVVIDLWTYRRHGHNEGDEPAFTQPVMYRAIARKPTLKALYAQALVKEGTLAAGELEQMVARYRARLEEAYHDSAKIAVQAGAPPMTGFWKDFRGGAMGREEPQTGVAPDVLRKVGDLLVEVPRGFRVHPKLAKVLEARAQMVRGEKPVDWAMAEELALGTLAWEGTRIRLSGQDTRRGTFSHRHAVLYDHESGIPYSPLAHLRSGQGPVEIRDSLLSEAGALGFEYGYSLEMPDALTVWEAQFGDFVNAAQVIIDQFLSSGEAKWNRLSGLALLLPHGMEGQGPEHSSARLERFLELSVDDNWRVVNLTTPAQYFHALRRQVRSPYRKPLVVMSPKSLLRHPKVVSPLDQLVQERFRPVIDDEWVDPTETTRVVLCSGKLYYDLAAAREAQGARHAAIVRLEQLYPLDVESVRTAIARFRPGVEIVWSQEEPSNMGAWDYVNAHLAPRLPSRIALVSRGPSASPAAGSATRHRLEQEQLVREALGEPVSRIRAERAAAQER